MVEVKRKNTRNIKITQGINPYAYGSVICEVGNTKIHITASVDENVPRWMKNSGKGWVTAEYSMLPGSTHQRIDRERKGPKGRTQEIQRLIGRSLRAIVDLKKLGERQVIIDCDVLVADGGTRTASITGAYVALELAIKKLIQEEKITESPLREKLAAISVGLDQEGKVLVDLNYEEDSSCHADVNVVMTESGRIVEVQATAEEEPFSREDFDTIINSAAEALKSVFSIQNEVLND